jgi:predicted dehydrogenase
MKAGILSFAHMHAYRYAQLLTEHPDAEVSYVWDADTERGRRAAAQFGAVYCEDLDDFLQQPFEAVLVCSENAMHKEHVIKAARAGKHILCEKPIAVHSADAEEMIRVCRDNGVLLQIAFPVRYAAAVKRARSLIQAGELGEILAINSTNRGKMPGGWFVDPALSGGGAAIDHIVHLMDIFHWILESEVKRVYAELDTRYYDLEVEDCGIIMLEMANGTVITIDPSWSRPASFPVWGDLTMEIVGEKGTMSLDIFKQSSLWYGNQDKPAVRLPWLDDIDEGLIADFVETVKRRAAPAITGEDGLRTLKVVEACYASLRSGRFVELS